MNGEIVQFPEERIPVPLSFVEHTRQAHQQMLICIESIREEAIRKGNTILAVKTTDMMKAIKEASHSFENLVDRGFDVITDKEYKKLYPEKYALLMREQDGSQARRKM